MRNWKDTLGASIFTILCIVCFPANPLVLTGLIETDFYLASSIVGGVVWAFGMVLVMSPIIMFPRQVVSPGAKHS